MLLPSTCPAVGAAAQEERARTQRALDRSIDEYSNESDRGHPGDLTAMPFHLADQGPDTMHAELDASNATRMSRRGQAGG